MRIVEDCERAFVARRLLVTPAHQSFSLMARAFARREAQSSVTLANGTRFARAGTSRGEWGREGKNVGRRRNSGWNDSRGQRARLHHQCAKFADGGIIRSAFEAALRIACGKFYCVWLWPKGLNRFSDAVLPCNQCLIECRDANSR